MSKPPKKVNLPPGTSAKNKFGFVSLSQTTMQELTLKSATGRANNSKRKPSLPKLPWDKDTKDE